MLVKGKAFEKYNMVDFKSGVRKQLIFLHVSPVQLVELSQCSFGCREMIGPMNKSPAIAYETKLSVCPLHCTRIASRMYWSFSYVFLTYVQQ